MAGEINETADQTASCGAIAEKRANRPGGCVGIFFQLFDWNRRFAKKKLFSHKSLLPGAKQASKRFGGNEKMPKSKFHLIADEKRGGFPNLKRNEVMEPRKHEMKSPSLVARLMGLESIPAIHRDKPKKKSSVSQIHKNVLEDELVNKPNVFSREEESGLEKLRPQKLQKTTTGVCDRRVAKRFGSEALQIKNVLTRARKRHQYVHQHQKLASPVRSPRPYRKSSRLMDAAARILEPGLQSKNRAKPAIAYSGSRFYGDVGTDSAEVVSPDSLEFQRRCYCVASCKNCGSLVDVLGSGPGVEETGKNMANISEPFKERNLFREIKNRNEVQNQMLERERLPPEAQLHNLHSTRASPSATHVFSCKEDFIAMNRNSNGRNRSRISSQVENSDLDLQRRPYTRFDDSYPLRLIDSPRKRRISSVSGHRSDVNATCAGNRAVRSAENDCVPLKLSSSTRGNSRSFRESKERKRVQGNSNQAVENRHLKTPLQKGKPMDGDSVRVLLRRKLKELASQEQDEAIREGAFESKFTSMILQELISALAFEQTVTGRTDTLDDETTYGSKGKRGMRSLGYEHNGDYMSPGSVLEASFSNESCFSNSFDDSSGQIRLSLEPTYHQLNSSEPDFELLEDSATSIKTPTPVNYQWITNLINHASNVLRSLNKTNLRSTQCKFKFASAREVIIHTELLYRATQDENFLISPQLLNGLMIHATRSEIPLYLPRFARGFLVDAMIEFLDLRYCQHKFSGFKQWRALPFCTNAEVLTQEVIEEIMKWAELAEMTLDEIIEFEMENWLDLDNIVSELGTEIACVILQGLICEVAVDL